MADGVPITAGSGTLVASDDLTSDGTVGGHVQLLKLVDGTDGGNVRVPAVAGKGLAVEPRPTAKRIAATPTVSTSPAYSAKDAIGGLLTFSNAARSSGGSLLVHAVQIEDKGQQMPDLDLVLFDRSIGAPTDNAVFNPTDTEVGQCVGVIPIIGADWADFSTNSVATRVGLGLELVLNGTDLFGVLVSRGTPTFTSTSDVVVTLTVLQD